MVQGAGRGEYDLPKRLACPPQTARAVRNHIDLVFSPYCAWSFHYFGSALRVWQEGEQVGKGLSRHGQRLPPSLLLGHVTIAASNARRAGNTAQG